MSQHILSSPTSFPSFTKTWHTTRYPAIDPSRAELTAKGKNIVITGAGSGIGAEIADFFAQAGASSISILGRRENLLLETKDKIGRRFPEVKVYTHTVDITSEAGVKRVFADIHTRAGPIHVYVNNAGYLQDGCPIKSIPVEDWWQSFEVNVKGSFITTQVFLQYADPKATLVNVSSSVAHFNFGPNYSSYGASKIAGIHFFASVQLGNPELKVISVQPGIIDTAMTDKSKVPAQDDVSLAGGFIVWLASPEATFLKGKFVWANWDVEEMKARAEEIMGSNLLSIDLAGWPFEEKVPVTG